MWAVRLKTRGRIGMKVFGLVYAKPVASARTDPGHAGEISSFFRFQRMKRSLCVFRCVFFENKIDMFSLGRPHPKMCFVLADQFRANRIATFCERRHATPSLINCFGNFAFPVQHLRSRTCGRLLRKQPLERPCLSSTVATTRLIALVEASQNRAHEWNEAENRNLQTVW